MENPIITIDKLEDINKKVNNNTASIKEYEELAYFLSRFKMENYILENMRNVGFLNYQDFITYRNKPDVLKNLSFQEGIVLGTINECINILKNSLSAKKI